MNNGKDDPALHPVEIPHEELVALVRRISRPTSSGYTELRNKIDGVLRAIEEREKRTLETVQAYRDDAEASLDVVAVMLEHMTKLQDRMKLIEAAPAPEPAKELPGPMRGIPEPRNINEDPFSNMLAARKRPNNETQG